MKNLQELIESAKYPVALTGAGISAPSGIPTFDMLWKGRPVREFLSREFFIENPVEFYELFREILKWRNKHPNYVHRALAHYNFSVVTQNVDGLHKKAGSKKVIELHGNIEYIKCPECGYKKDTIRIPQVNENTVDENSKSEELPSEHSSGYQCLPIQPLLTVEEAIYCKQCNTLMEPEIVLYGDQPKGWWDAFEEVAQADLLLVIGTSLQTYPANQLPIMAERNGCQVIKINDDCLKAFTFFNEMRKETLTIEFSEDKGN